MGVGSPRFIIYFNPILILNLDGLFDPSFSKFAIFLVFHYNTIVVTSNLSIICYLSLRDMYFLKLTLIHQ